MYAISASENVEVSPGCELMFLCNEHAGFYDCDVKKEVRDDAGVLIETQYLGEPLEVKIVQAADWRRVIAHFAEVESKHHYGLVNTWSDLKSMAQVNAECHQACLEFERVQREIHQGFVDQSMVWAKPWLESGELGEAAS